MWERGRRTDDVGSVAETRRRCEKRLDELGLSAPVDLDALCAVVVERRAKPLRVLPKPPLADLGPCGLWISTAEEDIIFVERGTSIMHAEHILLHELGHLVFEHRFLADQRQYYAERLLPDLEPSLIDFMLSRYQYVDHQEREAEMFATLLLSNSQWGGVPMAALDLPSSVKAVFEALYC